MLKKNQLKDWKDIKSILYHQNLSYMLKIICSKVISCYHNNLFVSYILIKKTEKLVAKKYFELIVYQDIKAFIKSYDICLLLKAVCYKSYKNFQLLPMFTHCLKNLLINFLISLELLVDWKSNSYNAILVIIDCLKKMVYYKPI